MRPARSDAPPRRAWVEQIMGLPVSVHVRGTELTSAQVEGRVQAVFADLHRADSVFSTYRNDSDLSRWENGALRPEDADPALAQVLALCEEARQGTGGWFDPRGLPDPIDGRLRYDPSGLVKGWAVERASRHMAELGDHDWCLNAGGDIVVFTSAGNAAWRVGIEDPADPQRVMAVVPLRVGAMATSGISHRGAHIIDPFTRRPATALRSVSVTGPSLLWSDVYATAAFAMGGQALDWLEGVSGYEALLIDIGGSAITTGGWRA